MSGFCYEAWGMKREVIFLSPDSAPCLVHTGIIHCLLTKWLYGSTNEWKNLTQPMMHVLIYQGRWSAPLSFFLHMFIRPPAPLMQGPPHLPSSRDLLCKSQVLTTTTNPNSLFLSQGLCPFLPCGQFFPKIFIGSLPPFILVPLCQFTKETFPATLSKTVTSPPSPSLSNPSPWWIFLH